VLLQDTHRDLRRLPAVLLKLIFWAFAQQQLLQQVLPPGLYGYTEMSEAFRSLENQYAVEIVKEKPNADIIERLLLGMRNLRAAAEPTGQCSDGTHFQIPLGRLFILTHGASVHPHTWGVCSSSHTDACVKQNVSVCQHVSRCSCLLYHR